MIESVKPFGEHCIAILGSSGKPLIPCPNDWNGLVVERREVPSFAECGPQFTGMPTITISLSGGGERWYRANGRTINFCAGPQNMMTLCKSYERDSGRWEGKHGESIFLRFPEKVLQHYFQDESLGFDLPTKYQNVDDTFRRCVIALAEEMQHGLPNGRLYAEGVSMQIMAWLMAHYVQRTNIRSSVIGAGFSITQKIRVSELIEYCFDSDLTLERMAEEVGLSTFHFIRLFRRTFCQTPHQYLMAKRLDHAKKLLRRNPHMSIADIAFQSGFSSQAHFTFAFRKICGEAPARWRSC